VVLGMLAFFYVTAALVVLCAGAWMASTPWLEGIEAIVLRTDLTLRKEIPWESETSYRRRGSSHGDEIEPGKRY
jgi:hypothetical protein